MWELDGADIHMATPFAKRSFYARLVLSERRYAIKWFLSQVLSFISIIFWHVPSTDADVVECVEGATLCTVLRRDHEAEAAEKVRKNLV